MTNNGYINIMRYLDPKAGLTFKRVFGEHPDLVMGSIIITVWFIRHTEKVIEGMQKGLEEGIKEVARCLKMAGIPTAIIMESTDLSEIEI